MGYTSKEVAEALLVSRNTLWRRLTEARVYSTISDEELDRHIQDLQIRYSNSGQVMLHSMLTALGTHIQRLRLREYRKD